MLQRSYIMNLCSSICFILLLRTFKADGTNGICNLDGQWYDSYSTSSREVNKINDILILILILLADNY